MKKLMIAAAAAALVSGAYAGCSEDPDTPCSCELYDAVYSWQFKGKTGVGVLVKAVDAVKGTKGGSCAEGDSGSGALYEVVRIPGSLSLIGYSYICDLECNQLASKLVAPSKAQFYMTSPLKSLITPYRGKNFITAIDVAHVIGKTATQYELAGKAEFDLGTSDASDVQQLYALTFAGFGAFDKKNHRVSSVSGNFAGTQKIPRYNGKLMSSSGALMACPGAGYWDCCCLTYVDGSEAPSDANLSVAYGTWSMKYNAAATKQIQTRFNSYWVK